MRLKAVSGKILTLFLTGMLTFFFNVTLVEAESNKAVIVDQLSLRAPNQTFVQTSTEILETSGFSVDYYSGEEVNVNFYRNLPTHDYSLMVLRVHSTFAGESVVLFTSEPYSPTKHIDEQLTDQVGAVAYSVEEAEKGNIYFGIMPPFIEYSMDGTFNNTVIIMMGSDGLMYTPMAEAFVSKGAKVCIGWNGSVSLAHADQATTHLLEHLITETQTVRQAVTETTEEVGECPIHGSTLLFYPAQAENYIIPEFSTALILPLFMIATLLAVIIHKRKQSPH